MMRRISIVLIFALVLFFGLNEILISKDVIKIGSRFNMYVNIFLSRVFDRHGFGSIVATKKFKKLMNDGCILGLDESQFAKNKDAVQSSSESGHCFLFL